MGVRLYPRTEDPARLEALCGVPAGTAARLAELRERPEFRLLPTDDFFERDRKCGGVYEAAHADGPMGDYYDFLSDGWGRLDDGAWDVLEAWFRQRGEEICFDAGECPDPAVAAAALLAQSRKSLRAARYLRERGRDSARGGPALAAAGMADLAEGLHWS